MNRAWDSSCLVRWYFGQDEFWITTEQDKVLVSKMALGNVLSALLLLERAADDITHYRTEIQDTPLYKALYRRLLAALGEPDAEGDVPIELDDPDEEELVLTTTPEIRAAIIEAIVENKNILVDYTDVFGNFTSSREVQPVAVEDYRSGASPFREHVMTANHDNVLKTFYLSRISAVEMVV